MNSTKQSRTIEQWHPSLCCCDEVWEAAYQRFETPEEEIRKIRRRLISAGALGWPRDAAIVELFCGRGNGLKALASLGFRSLSGVDLSAPLLQSYDGEARLFLGDCRDLKLADRSVDVIVLQGGLHHLPEFPDDLEKTLREIRRVLRPSGCFVLVEPWETPFLQFVHVCCRSAVLRRLWGKLDALATMIERERTTYERWLRHPQEILQLLHRNFQPEKETVAWGKLAFVGRPVL